MSGLFNMFRTPAAPTAPNTATPQSGAPNPIANPATNPTIPSSATPQSDGSVGAIPAAGTGDKSPLDGYAKMWDKPAAGSQPDPSLTALAPDLTFKPEDLMTAARGVDFVKSIPIELLQKAASGNAEALQAAINMGAQNGYAQAAGATARIVADVVAKQNKAFQEVLLPKIFKDYEASRAVQSAVPTLANNPAAAPMISMLEKQFQQAYPGATSDQIKQHAQTYLDGFAAEIVKANGGTITPKATTTTEDNPFLPKPRSAEVDWTNYFGVSAV